MGKKSKVDQKRKEGILVRVRLRRGQGLQKGEGQKGQGVIIFVKFSSGSSSKVGSERGRGVCSFQGILHRQSFNRVIGRGERRRQTEESEEGEKASEGERVSGEGRCPSERKGEADELTGGPEQKGKPAKQGSRQESARREGG